MPANRRDIRASADQHRPGAAVFRPYVRVRSTLLERGERWRHGTSRTLGPFDLYQAAEPFCGVQVPEPAVLRAKRDALVVYLIPICVDCERMMRLSRSPRLDPPASSGNSARGRQHTWELLTPWHADQV